MVFVRETKALENANGRVDMDAKCFSWRSW